MTRIVTYPIVEDELAIVLSCKADGTFGLKIGFGDEEEELFGKRRDLRIKVKELVKAIGIKKSPPPGIIIGEPPILPEVEPEEEGARKEERRLSPEEEPEVVRKPNGNGEKIRNGIKGLFNGGKKDA